MGLLLKVDDSESHRASSFFVVPRLFVGFSSKGLSVLDCDSVKSPTSPLDLKAFSNLGNSLYAFPRSPHQKSWDHSKLGLSIVDCLDDDLVKGSSGIVPGSSESKNILFGPGVRNKTSNSQAHTNNSLPRNFAILARNSNTHAKSPLQKGKGSSDVFFEIGVSQYDPEPEPEPFGRIRSHSLDSYRSFSNPLPVATSGNKCNSTVSVSANEIELSEDYTCVISHGPNPKKTHIYGDCVLECHSDEIGVPSWNAMHSVCPASLAVDHFLSYCHYCNKKLEDGKDIYIYRGEKTFCSLSCRSQEIMIDEEVEEEENAMNDFSGDMSEVLEKTMNKSWEDIEEDNNELSESSILYAP
ncbi:FCS-Like Zinc finger 11 [Linum grandiflorum]